MVASIDLPAAARCSIGTSLTVVPGLLANLPQYPILLVTSCWNSNQLFFLNISTNPATLVKTLTVPSTPTGGWGSFTLRGDRGDILACGNRTGGIYPIHRVNVADGTSTLLFNATNAGLTPCDGVTWDAEDDTVFVSPDVSDTIYRYSEAGAFLGTLAVPAGCPNSGLAIGGPSLFAACNGVLRINRLNKLTGAVIESFATTGQSRTEDLECDPVSFSSQRKDVMWSKDAFDNKVFAFEIPSGSCGLAGGPPPPVPAPCADTDGNGNPDNDGDGLCDNWEVSGIDYNNDGVVDLQLYDMNGDGTVDAAERADLNVKDLYIEVDYMAQHQPLSTAIADVVAAFAAQGIRLHVQVNEEAVAHNASLAFQPCTDSGPAGTPNFDAVKNAFFGTAAERASGVPRISAKRFAFRYALFIHNLVGTTSSGCAELPGNDFVVSLGSFTLVSGHNVGTRDQQAGTLMHELGHTLNLGHGGGDLFQNCKPNYLSVMSYTRQFNTFIPTRPLDYSRAALPNLNEAALSEPAGLGGTGLETVFGPLSGAMPAVVAPAVAVNTASGWFVRVPSNAPVDWNKDGDATDVGVSANVNSFAAAGCGGFGSDLSGFNDWANLQYNFRSSTDFADGVHLTTLQAPEITFEQANAVNPDDDGDGVANLNDNCPVVSNATQQDSDGNGIGDACEQTLPSLQRACGSLPNAPPGLCRHLQLAAEALARANHSLACSQLAAFINQVNGLVPVRLSAADAAILVTGATAVRSSLGCR
ncbi:MAG: hypothetical protein SFV54_03160 [Bryobacteraceae bacterium]|nr:hypothetical protein [Bryobacteraceae bacterium]